MSESEIKSMVEKPKMESKSPAADQKKDSNEVKKAEEPEETPSVDEDLKDIEKAKQPEETSSVDKKKDSQDVEKAGQPEKEQKSLAQRLEQAWKFAPNPLIFLKNVFVILLNTIGFLILLGIFVVLPIAMIVVGSLNLQECRVQRYIPIWLIVSGSVSTFMTLVFIIKSLRGKRKKKLPEDQECNFSYSGFNFLLSLFEFAWFIVGNVWVFGSFHPNIEDKTNRLYCDGGTYYFAFVLIILGYVWVLLSCCCSGCLAICALASKKATHRISSTIRRQMPSSSKEESSEANNISPEQKEPEPLEETKKETTA